MGSVVTETVDVKCRSMVGSDGVWNITGPVPTVGGGASAEMDPVRPRRRRHQRNAPERTRRRPAHTPTAMPPIVPALSLNEIEFNHQFHRIQGLYPYEDEDLPPEFQETRHVSSQEGDESGEVGSPCRL